MGQEGETRAHVQRVSSYMSKCTCTCIYHPRVSNLSLKNELFQASYMYMFIALISVVLLLYCLTFLLSCDVHVHCIIMDACVVHEDKWTC